MNDRLFLIHWNKAEAEGLAAPLRVRGWEVQIEGEDGQRAWKRITANQPAVVVIYLRRLPSHGRMTARALRSQGATRNIPIIFVDGAADKVAVVREQVPDAVYTDGGGLDALLAQYAAGGLCAQKRDGPGSPYSASASSFNLRNCLAAIRPVNHPNSPPISRAKPDV